MFRVPPLTGLPSLLLPEPLLSPAPHAPVISAVAHAAAKSAYLRLEIFMCSSSECRPTAGRLTLRTRLIEAKHKDRGTAFVTDPISRTPSPIAGRVELDRGLGLGARRRGIHPGFLALRGRDRRRSCRERVISPAALGEGDHLADGVRTTEQRADPVPAEGDAPVR